MSPAVVGIDAKIKGWKAAKLCFRSLIASIFNQRREGDPPSDSLLRNDILLGARTHLIRRKEAGRRSLSMSRAIHPVQELSRAPPVAPSPTPSLLCPGREVEMSRAASAQLSPSS